jgi:hypothetical protein
VREGCFADEQVVPGAVAAFIGRSTCPRSGFSPGGGVLQEAPPCDLVGRKSPAPTGR